MKNKTKSRLLKTRGIIKKACMWAPIATSVIGLGLGLGFLIDGGIKYSNAIDDFKDSEIFTQAIYREVDDMQSQLKNGEIKFNDYAEKLEEITSDDHVVAILKQSGEGASEYKAQYDKGKTYMLASIAGFGTFVIGGAMCIPWYALSFVDDIEYSADEDLARSLDLLRQADNPPPPPKKKKEDDEFAESEDDEEKLLPDISESYYND